MHESSIILHGLIIIYVFIYLIRYFTKSIIHFCFNYIKENFMLNDICFVLGIIFMFQLQTLPAGLLLILFSVFLRKKKVRKFDDITF